MAKRLLTGTRNLSRIHIVRQILDAIGVEVLTLEDAGIYQEVEENGASSEMNARLKARQYCALAGMPTLAMDGALHVERFTPEQQPGVLVRRMAGLGQAATDEDLLDFYMKALEAVGGESLGTWSGSQVLAFPDGRLISHTFTFDVWFTQKRHSRMFPGRPLDSLMYDPRQGRYFAEMALEELPYYGPIREFLLKNVALL